MFDPVAVRREFHHYPEAGWQEVRTSARIAEMLEQLGVPVVLQGEEVVDLALLATGPGIDLSEETRRAHMQRAVAEGAKETYVEAAKGYPGVIGIIDTGRPGPTYAFRFDIDCLEYDEYDGAGSAPAEEDYYRPSAEGYRSSHAGRVHACGHDGHTAIGLALAAKIMASLQGEADGSAQAGADSGAQGDYKGIIKLIFQPAEENYLGAASIVAKGHLDDVDQVMAVHLAISAENEPLPSHSLCCGVKDFMACRQLDVTYHGVAAHPCGAAQEGKNALLACCSAALNLHAIAMHEKGLGRVNVGVIRGGEVTNTICPECTICLEYRGQYREISDYIGRRVFDILDGTARQYDMDYTYIDYGEIPAGQSNDALMAAVQEEAGKIPWFETIHYEGNVGGSDDAAVMINHVQDHGGLGTYIGIGCATTGPLHNPKFDFDESALDAAAELLTRMLRR